MTGGINKLTAVAVQKTKEPGYYGDGGGLWLQLSKLGGKSWAFRFTIHGKRREMGLGPVHTVTLAEARDQATELRKQIRAGIDPIEQRKTDKGQAATLAAKSAKTFKECAAAYIDAQRAGWSNPKHAAQWQNTLATYAHPTLGQLPVAAVDTELVLKVLRQASGNAQKPTLWEGKNETANRVRARIENILDWAKFKGYREGENPARWRGHLDKELPPPRKVKKVKHHAALPFAEMGAFMTDLRKREGIAARALEFAILTAARSSEVREATWDEINLAAKLWTVPAERIKARKLHRVPLSARAVTLLKALPRIQGCDFVFPGSQGRALSENTLGEVLARMGRDDITAHGTARSSFKDWARSCTTYSDEVSELALAHVNNDETRAAYARDELLPLRTNLMDDWTKYCNTKPKTTSGKVVPFKRKRA